MYSPWNRTIQHKSIQEAVNIFNMLSLFTCLQLPRTRTYFAGQIRIPLLLSKKRFPPQINSNGFNCSLEVVKHSLLEKLKHKSRLAALNTTCEAPQPFYPVQPPLKYLLTYWPSVWIQSPAQPEQLEIFLPFSTHIPIQLQIYITYVYSRLKLYTDIFYTYCNISVSHDLAKTYMEATSRNSSFPIALNRKVTPDLLTHRS